MFKENFLKLTKNQLITGSFILFIGTTIANFGNYLYHLLMGRMLGPSGYGVLVSLISLIYMISVASVTLNTVVVRFVSVYKVKGDYGRIYSLFREFSLRFLILGGIIFALFILGHQSVADFLKITNYRAILLISSAFLIRFLVPVNNGLLQGFLNFKFLSANHIIAAVLKLGLGVFLVWTGMSVLGAVASIVIADYLTYLISFLPLRFLLKYRPKLIKINWQEKAVYAAPTFFAVLGLNSLYTTDIILVKHFFEPYQAGLYSALGMLGKIIFFASVAVTTAMFPLTAEKYESGKKYQKVLTQAMLIVGLISFGITAFYFLLPRLMIQILYGSSYLEIAPLLGYFGFFLSFYSLVNVLVNFFLSIHQTRIAIFPCLAAGFQAILIWFFHDSLFQVIQISIGVTTMLFLSLLLYNGSLSKLLLKSGQVKIK